MCEPQHLFLEPYPAELSAGHNVPSGYAGGYASIPRRGHAPVVHEDADNRLRCSSCHRDAENCGVTRKYAKNSGHAPSLIVLTRHDRGMLEIPPGPSLHPTSLTKLENILDENSGKEMSGRDARPVKAGHLII
ncbi:hypothetical protein RB195_010310 [Necator americanus]|uniref:Cytochrome c domain-containing protein n=1 Tax=Necator americanus TaxID=51031 RepID=A0ABR1CZ68_NECAM